MTNENVSRPNAPVNGAVTISIGCGKRNAQAERLTCVDLSGMNDREPDVETWWSGHLWKGDKRSTLAWEVTTVAVADVDYPKPAGWPPDKQAHAPAEMHALIDPSTLPGHFVYLTPNGVRAAVVLATPETNKERAQKLCLGLCRAVVAALEAQGIVGYVGDEGATKDWARLMYCPNAFCKGEQRTAVGVAGVPIDERELLRLGEAPSTGDTGAVLRSLFAEQTDVRAMLAALEAEGENDGSRELIICAAKAIAAGVCEASDFIDVSATWNARRKQPWTAEELIRRFDDAWRRHEESGRVQIRPGKYRLSDLRTILSGDRKYASLAWDVWEEMPRLNKQLVTQRDLANIRTDICARYYYPSIPKEDLRDELMAVAGAVPFDRVAAFLAALPEWDGLDRFGELVKRMSVVLPDPVLATTYMRKIMIGAISRAVMPGCKFDVAVVLQGPDGTGKSTLVQTLAGTENFADTPVDLNSKDGYQQVHRVWIYELSELGATTKRADMERVKNFLSSQADNYRAPYDKVPALHWRRGICLATCNPREVLLDQDSDRRWWIISVDRPGIDREWVERNRSMLWAQALNAYAVGETSYLSTAEEQARRDVAVEWKPDAPLEGVLEQALAAIEATPNFPGWFLSLDLYRRAGLDPVRESGQTRGNVSRWLYAQGYSRKVPYHSGGKKVGARWIKRDGEKQ